VRCPPFRCTRGMFEGLGADKPASPPGVAFLCPIENASKWSNRYVIQIFLPVTD
jgi:hypothetical protein